MERNAPTTDWDLDSDEIASVTSEDLHSNRPNRWTGPKSSWRLLTQEERLLWRSVRQLEDQDLAAHLYDAFALRRAGGSAETARGLTVKMEDGQDAIWAPPKLWTSWPLKERHMPQEGLIKKQDDEDEKFTFRMEEKKIPSAELQGELGATILRLAKERFRKRTRTRPVQASIESAAAAESSLPSSPPVSGSAESGEDSGRMQIDSDVTSPHGGRPKAYEPQTYEPVVCTNDDLSYALLRPSVRHILSQLDTTLSILHNARVAGLSYLSESSTESDSDAQPQTPRKRSRGRPRRTPQPGDVADADDDTAGRSSSVGGRGRPRRVHMPRDGETEADMKLRVAREGHRRLPLTQADRDAAFEEWLRRGDAKIEQRERERQLAEEPATGDDDTDAAGDACDAGDTGESNVEKKLRRWGIRDWSDVVGAAALAGFSEDVIKRTTRRCANLFGQGMVIRRLDEVPHSRGAGFHTMDYQPERIRLAPSSPSSDDDLNPAPTLPQRRLASLASSASPRGRPSAAASRSVSRSRSRSSAGLLFCPLATCDRATTGFSRRSNLRRHMQLVHPGHAGEEHDSEDEAVGAVHVDGFLRTIQVARGWRGEDAVERRRKRSWGGRPIHSGSRSRAQSDGDGDDEEAGDESS